MILLAVRNLIRRPLRNVLALLGLSVAIAVLACLAAFGQGYRQALQVELNHAGLQLMLVPLGCPYDAAAQVLKGKALENSLPASAVRDAQRDPVVAVAAPMLLVALPRPREGRSDMWAGIDKSALQLKPWWRMASGTRWFPNNNSVILGAEAAAVETRVVGDKFYSPETKRTLRVAGVLQRSGTSDDSLFFVPLATAQKMFHQPGRLTAIAIRLRDPAQMGATSERLQRIPGAQVVTLTEMMGTFLTLVGTVRALMLSLGMVAVVISLLSVFNTLLAAIVERAGELAMMRACGASRLQIFGLITIESLLLTLTGSLSGMLLAVIAGHSFENLAQRLVPLASSTPMLSLTFTVVAQCLIVGVGCGMLAGLYPAWQGSRLQPAAAAKPE